MKLKKNRGKIVAKLLIGLLGLLGFSACEEEMRAMYGTPHATYNLKFQLTDEANKPLESTQLRVNNLGRNMLLFTPLEKLKTNSEGKIDCSVEGFGIINKNTYLVYYEKDNEHHSGTFKEDSVKVTDIKKIEEGKGWHRGTYELKATLKLKKK